MMRARLVLLLVVPLVVSACSQYKAQCHEAALAATAAQNAFVEMRNAADVGDTNRFGGAKNDFERAISVLSAISIEGNGLKEIGLRDDIKTLLDAAPRARRRP